MGFYGTFSKKIYAQLNEAHTRAIAIYGPFENRFPAEVGYRPGGWQCYSCAAVYTDRIAEFLKVQKYCRAQSSPIGCAANSKIKKVDLTESNSNYYTLAYANKSPQFVLADGAFVIYTLIEFPYCDQNGYNLSDAMNYCGYLEVDIDRPNKGKNAYNWDIFQFAITKDGIVPYISSNKLSSSINNLTYCMENFSSSHGCAAWVLEKDNMDYLDVKDLGLNMGYSGFHCKSDGRTLTWERGSCR